MLVKNDQSIKVYSVYVVSSFSSLFSVFFFYLSLLSLQSNAISLSMLNALLRKTRKFNIYICENQTEKEQKKKNVVIVNRTAHKRKNYSFFSLFLHDTFIWKNRKLELTAWDHLNSKNFSFFCL